MGEEKFGQYREFFELTPDLSCIANKEGYFLYLSPNWKKELGWEIDELKAHPFLYFVHEDDREETIREMDKLVSGHKTLNFENRYLMKNGGYRYLSWNAKFDHGRYYAQAHDVTALKELETLKEKAETSAKLALIGEMTCGVAHELSTPIAIIKGTYEMLSEQNLPPQSMHLLEMMEKALSQTTHIISGIKNVAVTRTNLGCSRVDVSQVVERAVSFVSQKLAKDEIEMRLDIEEAEIVTDPGDLLQILLNLLSNAQFAVSKLPKPRWIEIAISRNNGSLSLDCKDCGGGIDPEIALKVMEPFFTTKDGSEGIGLGLSISRRLAEKNFGTLEYIESSKVTHFRLTLPEIRPANRKS